MNEPAQLYRHFDAEGNLLYVGTSLSAVYRLAQHRSRTPWYSAIARVTIQNCESLSAARAAECRAIVAERPRHNITFNNPEPRDAGDRLVVEQADTIRDLRARLDASEDERRRIQAQLTALLTDQRPAAPTSMWGRFLAWRRP